MSALSLPGPIPSSQRNAYLILRSLNQIFALPVIFAQSVFRLEALTRVPLAPRHLIGLANLRGRIVPVACLARRLEPSAAARGRGSMAIVIDLGIETFALAIDEIGDVVYADEKEIIAQPAQLGLRHSGILTGVLQRQDSLIPILDVARIFEFRRKPEAA
jgi:purine-binding chemotaxis protein CheW